MITEEQALEYSIGSMGIIKSAIYNFLPNKYRRWIFRTKYKRYKEFLTYYKTNQP